MMLDIIFIPKRKIQKIAKANPNHLHPLILYQMVTYINSMVIFFFFSINFPLCTSFCVQGANWQIQCIKLFSLKKYLTSRLNFYYNLFINFINILTHKSYQIKFKELFLSFFPLFFSLPFRNHYLFQLLENVNKYLDNLFKFIT